MWQAEVDPLDAGRVQGIRIRHGASLLSYADVLESLTQEADFRAFFNRLLAGSPYEACFWETPPVTRQSIGQTFECVLVDAPGLAGVTADAGTFSRYFSQTEDTVAGFPNLGRDAWLIAPCPRGPLHVYAHLAAFVRGAPAEQQQAFWERVGDAVRDRLGSKPLWLSTSGLGVYWLHARLDSTPKYYTWQPYRQILRKGGYKLQSKPLSEN
jgi:hypothetical protein